jgi:hypothetical protein
MPDDSSCAPAKSARSPGIMPSVVDRDGGNRSSARHWSRWKGELAHAIRPHSRPSGKDDHLLGQLPYRIQREHSSDVVPATASPGIRVEAGRLTAAFNLVGATARKTVLHSWAALDSVCSPRRGPKGSTRYRPCAKDHDQSSEDCTSRAASMACHRRTCALHSRSRVVGGRSVRFSWRARPAASTACCQDQITAP